jgi:murein DD-endopeptidase MepM/ murein hydrolase activator NlpD
MGDSRFAVVILDASGRPARRLRLAQRQLRAAAAAASALAVALLLCTGHGLWARKQAQVAWTLARENAELQVLAQGLEARLPQVRDAAAAAELSFVQLWAQSGLGLEPGLLDAPPPQTEAPPNEVPDTGGPQMADASESTAEPDLTASTAAAAATAAGASIEPSAAGPAALPAVDELDIFGLPDAARHLTSDARELAVALGDTVEYFHDAQRMLLNTPSIRPAHAWYSSSFGIRIHPITHALLMHKGLDMGGFIGMEIMAPADGVVIYTGLRGGYGQVVVIDHGFGLQTHFAHLSRARVHRGQAVHRGERIAEMGTTGHSTGPHLHYEVRRWGQPLDPRRFILD